MNIIDISWPVNENTTEYKNKNSLKFNHLKELEKDGNKESLITMSVHSGTHIDYPAHFLKDGKTVGEISLHKLIGECRVLDLTHLTEKITQKDLEPFTINSDDIILLKTKNSLLPETGLFYPDFVYLEKTGAGYLADKNIKAVGIDYLGIERNQPDHETHKFLMHKNIPIIEGLRLKDANKQNYVLYCLPIFLENLEAAPARAVLIG